MDVSLGACKKSRLGLRPGMAPRKSRREGKMREVVGTTKPVRAGEELNAEALEAYLLTHLPGARGPIAVEQFPGGASNLTYLIRLGDTELVLRRPPFGNRVKSAHDMGREYRVLSKLHSVYV